MNWKWLGVIIPVIIILALVFLAYSQVGVVTIKMKASSIYYDTLLGQNACNGGLLEPVRITYENTFFMDREVKPIKYTACLLPFEPVKTSTGDYLFLDVSQELADNLKGSISLPNRAYNSGNIPILKPHQSAEFAYRIKPVCTTEEYGFSEVLLVETKGYKDPVDCAGLSERQKKSALHYDIIR